MLFDLGEVKRKKSTTCAKCGQVVYKTGSDPTDDLL